MGKKSKEKIQLKRLTFSIGTSSFKYHQHDLLQILKTRDKDGFIEILQRANSEDINKVYESPEYKTCLDYTCEMGLADFAELLLQHGADPNKYNTLRQKAPLHIAANEGHFEVLEKLLNAGADVNIIDGRGQTALHIAAEKSSVDWLDVSKDNVLKKHFEAQFINCVETLIRFRADLELKSIAGKTPIQLAALRQAHSAVNVLRRHGSRIGQVNSIHTFSEALTLDYKTLKYNLFRAARGGNFLYFRELLEDASSANIDFDDYDGVYTFLQYACDRGDTQTARSLLEKGADPNAVCPVSNLGLPLLLAASHGYYEIIQLFVNTPGVRFDVTENEDNVLHSIVKMGSVLEDNDAKQDYCKCLDILFNESDCEIYKQLQLQINVADKWEHTPLHYAAYKNEEQMILTLLRHGAYLGTETGNPLNGPPVVFIDAAVLESFLDECITTEGEATRDDQYKIVFNYSFLAPRSVTHYSSFRYSNENEKGKQPKANSQIFKQESKPLLFISRSKEHRHLLVHPIITSFLFLKWHRLRWFFFFNFVFYFVFALFLTLYLDQEFGNDGRIFVMCKNSTKPPNQTNGRNEHEEPKRTIYWYIVSVLLICLLVREVTKFSFSPAVYFLYLKNIMEIVLIAMSGIVLCWNENDCNMNLKHHMAAYMVLIVWVELVLLAGHHPKFSAHIYMFLKLSFNLLVFLFSFLLIIIAFAMSFYLLFHGYPKNCENNVFADPIISFTKTLVMLTGEFELDEIPFEHFGVTSYIIFLTFVFFITIVLFNLLNGLIVSGTPANKKEADVVSYANLIELVYRVESMVIGEPLEFFIDWLKFEDLEGCYVCSLHKYSCFLRVIQRIAPIRNIILLSRMLPTKAIRVRNQTAQIFPKCCSSLLEKRKCKMDSRILDAAKKIVLNRKAISESEIIKRRLEKVEKMCEEQLVLLKEIKISVAFRQTQLSSSHDHDYVEIGD